MILDVKKFAKIVQKVPVFSGFPIITNVHLSH